VSLSLFPVPSTLEHMASVKRFVSLQFLNPKAVGKTPWTGDQPVARLLPIQTQNKHIQISMPWVAFEPTIPAFERAKRVVSRVYSIKKYDKWLIRKALKWRGHVLTEALSRHFPIETVKVHEITSIKIADVWAKFKKSTFQIPSLQPYL
jgi:hypothetical protein